MRAVRKRPSVCGSRPSLQISSRLRSSHIGGSSARPSAIRLLLTRGAAVTQAGGWFQALPSCKAILASSSAQAQQQGFSLAQSALDAGRWDFDTCLALLQEVLRPTGPTYFNFGACPLLKSGTCSLYSCSPEGAWSSLWINFDCKKLPRRDSHNASGSANFTFFLGVSGRSCALACNRSLGSTARSSARHASS